MPFPQKFPLARVIRTRGGIDGVLPIAKTIYDTHLKQIRQFQVAVSFFLDVCYTVDKVKVETIGQSAPTDISNNVQTVIGHELLKDLDWDSRDLNWLRETYSSFTSQTEFLTRWGKMKLKVLMNAMDHIESTRAYAMQRVRIPDQILAQVESQYESTENHIRETMEKLTELRKYGVKSSFTRRGFLPNSDNAWVLWDSRDFTQSLGVSRKGLIASVALATEASQIKDLRISNFLDEQKDMIAFELPFPASFFWMMKTDGEFDILTGLGSLPVREIFHKFGNELSYQAIRVQLMYHLYDLIVPVAKLATLPQVPTPKSGVLENLKNVLGIKKDPVVDLLLPRVRLLEDRQGITEATLQEIEAAARDTKQRAVRQHDVTDFIRPLPKGHRPSAVARALAMEAFGIVLGENETYVRAHKRGTGYSITAHEAKSKR